MCSPRLVTMTDRILTAPGDELRRSHTSLKWRAHPSDVLPLWVAEMDCEPCPAVVAAVSDAVRRGDTGYPWTHDYTEAFASFAATQWNWHLDARTERRRGRRPQRHRPPPRGPDGPGGAGRPELPRLQRLLHRHRLHRAQAPRCAPHAGRAPRPRVPLGRVRARDRGGARAAYLLSNPHNPTGTVHTPEELGTLARLADDHGVTVISDEIHAAVVYESGSFTPYLTVPGAERGVTVTSASKAWNLAGLKAGLIVPDPKPTQRSAASTRSSRSARATSVSSRTRRPGPEASTGSSASSRSSTPTATCSPSSSPTSCPGCACGCRKRPTSPGSTAGRSISVTTRQPGSVSVDGSPLSEGPSFGEGGRGCVRLNFATSPEILREAVARMARSID